MHPHQRQAAWQQQQQAAPIPASGAPSCRGGSAGGAAQQQQQQQQQQLSAPGAAAPGTAAAAGTGGPGAAAAPASGASGSAALAARYDVISKIGEGTYGLVYLAAARDGSRRLFAIKTFKTGRVGAGEGCCLIAHCSRIFAFVVFALWCCGMLAA
jgi:hypothetical protein